MVKKEITVAIFIGLLIGLAVTGGVLRARQALQPSPNPEKTQTITKNEKSSETTNKNEFHLDITTPEDNSIVNENEITLQGKTSPSTYIAIIAEKSEHLIVPDEVGSFTQKIDLIGGANTIKITAYTETGEKIEKTLNVVYTTHEI